MILKEKAKAKELMFLFANKIQKYDTILYQKKLAKKCALIAVDEIINSVVITDLTIAENQFIYWEKVKQEIDNL